MSDLPTADDINRAEFRMAKSGYDPDIIDELLERIARALDAGEPIQGLLSDLEVPKVRRGYDVDDVDALLHRLGAGAPQPRRQGGRATSSHSPVSEPRSLFGFLRRH